MQNELINKYLVCKHSTLLSYAIALYKVYEVENENLWTNEKEFALLMSGILEVYIGKYYLRDKNDIKQLNIKNLSNKDFKMTLSLAVLSDYFGENFTENKKKYKKSLYNLTIILYIVTNADKDISFYNKYNVTTKNILALIDKLFGDVIGESEISKNTFVLEMLANKIKDSEKMELRFFESLKSSESYLEYIKYSDEIFYTDYICELGSLDKFDTSDVEFVYKKYNYREIYYNIVYDLVSITLLKAFSNNCIVPNILVPINSNYLRLSSNINNLKRIFSNPYMKEKIMFSAKYSDYVKKTEEFSKLKELDFKLFLFLDKNEIILDFKNIPKEYEYFVTKQFINKNSGFEEYAEKSKIKYTIINRRRKYNEDELIELCLKKEN